MKLHPRVTRSLLELVKRFEGLRRRAARLPDGGWTIGYGHTRSAREGAVVDAPDAEALLHYDLSDVAGKVEAWTFTPLNQNQFEALTAFAFNIGVENFRHSTVLKRVNEGQHLLAAAALELWRKSDFDGEDLVIDALVRRRAAEKAHYLTPPEGFSPSPTPVLRPSFDHSVIEAAGAHASRSAIVVDAPLEGEHATAIVQRRLEDGENAGAPTPPFAPTARLHQLFPDKAAAPAVDPASFALESDAAPNPAAAINDQPFGHIAAYDADEPAPPLDAPPPPPKLAIGQGVFTGFAPPPARPVETLRALEPVAVATPWSGAQPFGEPAPLFDAPSARTPFPDPPRTPRWREMAGLAPQAQTSAREDDAEMVASHTPGPLHDRSMVYLGVGLLGAALFVAALVSMFSGKASAVNLVVGLMGIVLMTPAGGYFLLNALNRQDGVA